MEKRSKRIIWGLGAVAFVGGAAWFMAPKPSTHKTDAPSDRVLGGELALGGVFTDGDDSHSTSGSVKLVKHRDGYSMVLSDYQATSGPDVFFYLSTSSTGDFTEQAQRVQVPGGFGEGQATLRGDFEVPLPSSLDSQVGSYRSLIVWCARFNQRFGWAKLLPSQ